MGLQRMGGDAGIVSPDFAQQDVAFHRLPTGAIEEFQDIGFLLGQADLAVVLVRQHFCAGAEIVSADLEDRVFGLFVLAQLRVNAGKQNRKFKGFVHIIVGAGLETENCVRIRNVPGQHDDRAFHALFAHHATNLAPVHVRQADVQNDEVGRLGSGARDPFVAGRGLENIELVDRDQLLGKGFAQVVIIVDEQDFLGNRHRFAPHGLTLIRLSDKKFSRWQHFSAGTTTNRARICGNVSGSGVLESEITAYIRSIIEGAPCP